MKSSYLLIIVQIVLLGFEYSSIVSAINFLSSQLDTTNSGSLGNLLNSIPLPVNESLFAIR